MIASLTIGGVSIDMQTEAIECSVTVSPLRRSTIRRASNGAALKLTTAVNGKRALDVSASGLYLPDLSSVDFDSPVIVQWVEKDSGGGTAKSMTVVSDGIDSAKQDVKSVNSAWSLKGEEA